ncbi:T9SS type A sorting domain-containing protein [Aquimarina sp. ERC-38]|uniref:T9SS type A sorting domain-containing protein n=1 Tax=Aquimarina sp. ERC-38 TaxID=2949996 RepID=UPI0022468104|nr:T9SS type A sorting domain-containing protein [Aquimarina sp. ERC-38]UZO81917.1 T9SS type A sorting domain-containing protein [Aquimarina sp. ERC-38]
MKRILSLIAATLLFSSTAVTQISNGGLPPSFNNLDLKSNTAHTVKMPKIDYQKMLASDLSSTSKEEPLRFAYAHQLNLSPENSGTWYTDSEGNKYWKLSILSEGAKSLNLSFSDFYLPESAQLFIYNKDRTDIKGAFTYSNNKKSRQFGTAPVKGDFITIEYFEPKGTKTPYALKIETVAHDYRDVFKLAKSFNSSGSCNINVNCEEGDDWQNQKRSVALITLSNGTRWCTGSLINNEDNDGTPYFLTANHCLSNDVNRWVFYFNYESGDCTNEDSVLNQSISGSEVLASGSSSDYLLLKLSSEPPASYNVYYSGWDATSTIPSETVAIHHPAGDIKKISFDNDAPKISNYVSPEPATHWEVVDWDLGTTEKGSSGSPLFNTDKRIVGQLHGGAAACGNNQPDYYGRFSNSFPNFKEYLSKNRNLTVLDGYNPTFNTSCTKIDITLTLDNYPEETSWDLKNDSGAIVRSGSNYRNVADGTVINENYCLPSGCYTFTIYDSYGDGMCCGYGSGSYQVSDASGILASGATFTDSESSTFCIGAKRSPTSINRSLTEFSIIQPLNEIKLYPNPVKDVLFVDYKLKEGSSVILSLFDMTGRQLQTFNLKDDSQFDANQISVANLPSGNYFIKARENTNVVVKKFVVVK